MVVMNARGKIAAIREGDPMFRRFLFVVHIMAFAIVCSPASADDKTDCKRFVGAADAAVAACDRLLGSAEITDEDRADAYYFRGYHWTRKNEYRRAILDFSEVIKRRPRSTEVLRLRGEAYEKIGDVVNAFADYQAVLDINPKDSFAAMNLDRVEPKVPAESPVRRPGNVQDDQNVCERSQSSPDLALAACARLIASGSYNNDRLAKLHTHRGSAFAAKGDIARAIAEYGEAIRVDPNWASAYLSRAFNLARKGDHRGAIADLSEVIRIAPRHAIAHQRRAFAYEKIGEYAKALADFETCQAINPIDAVAQEGIRRMGQALAAQALQSLEE